MEQALHCAIRIQPTYSRHFLNTFYNVIQLPTPRPPCRLYKNMLKKLKNFTTRISTICVLCVSVNLTELLLTQYTTFNSNILYHSLTGSCNPNTMNSVPKPVCVCLIQCRLSHRLHHHKSTPDVASLHPHYKAGRRIRMGCMCQYFSFSTFHLV